MRIAYICADPEVPLFGTEKPSLEIQEMLRALRNNGAQIELFVKSLEGPRPSGFESMTIHKLTSPADDVNYAERADAEIRRLLSRKFSIDAIYERLTRGISAPAEMGSERGIPAVLEVPSRTSAGSVINEKALKLASSVVTFDEETASELRRQLKRNVFVVTTGYSGVSAANTRKPHDTFTIGYIGPLEFECGVVSLIESFSQLHRKYPKSRLIVSGSGSQKTAVISQLSRTGLLGTTRFLEPLSAEKLPVLTAAIDVMVAPFISAHPSFVITELYECMLAGVPVIASRIGSLPGLLKHMETGLLYEPGDSVALTEALQLLYEDRLLRVRIGNAARSSFLELHSWDRTANRLLQIMSEDMGNRVGHESLELSLFA